MARRFITQAEINLIDAINDELIEYVVGQEVTYYALALEQTNVHRLYQEAPKKTVLPPVKVNGRVKFDNPNTLSTGLGLDAKYEMEVYFHSRELNDRNLVPREGDFIEFGQIFFEVTSVTKPQLVYGQSQDRLMTKCVCTPSRQAQFQFASDVQTNVNNSHPVQNVPTPTPPTRR